MGVDYYAIAIIGCRVPVEKMWERRETKNCSHDIPDSAAYCSECGAKNAMNIEYARRFGVDRDDFVYIVSPGVGYSTVHPTEHGDVKFAISTDGRHVVAGMAIAGPHSGDDIAKQSLPDLETLRDQTRKSLESIDLWNEEEFGLWSLLYCSY